MFQLLSFQCHHSSPASAIMYLLALYISFSCFLNSHLFFIGAYWNSDFRVSCTSCTTLLQHVLYLFVASFLVTNGLFLPHVSLQLFLTLKGFYNWHVSQTHGSWLTLELVLLLASPNTSLLPFLVSLLSFFTLRRLLFTLVHVSFFYKQQIIPDLWYNFYLSKNIYM